MKQALSPHFHILPDPSLNHEAYTLFLTFIAVYIHKLVDL